MENLLLRWDVDINQKMLSTSSLGLGLSMKLEHKITTFYAENVDRKKSGITVMYSAWSFLVSREQQKGMRQDCLTGVFASAVKSIFNTCII